MLHDLIIWPRARSYANPILRDIRHTFRIINIFSILWDQEKRYENFSVFYSKSLLSYSQEKRKQTIRAKAEYCGEGSFILVVFEDPSPEMVYEQTTDGKSLVNARVFNKKKEYRELTGGGHLIHTSNNSWETDRDLTLLLSTGTEDFLRTYGHQIEERWIEEYRNCSGIGGYDSLSSFFYTLNHTINYCVLRNFDCLPNRYFENEHNDIDLLVEDLAHMVQLTSAIPISGSAGRVDYSIRIGGENIPFDFRYVGDNYFDIAWERHFLEHKKMELGAIYIPGDEDLYYSLLYHAYVQKRQIKPDYLSKLERYGNKIGVAYCNNVSDVFRQLDAFMEKHGYEYLAPNDKTVVFNLKNLAFSHYAFRNGMCLKHTEKRDCDYAYSSKVFEGKAHFLKEGSDWLMKNEAFFLEKLSSYGCFPKVISKQMHNNGIVSLTLSRINGVRVDWFFNDMAHQRASLLHSYITSMVDILLLLRKNRIEHRDLMPTNILVRQQGRHTIVNLIDFGWATISGDAAAKTPPHLGTRYALGDNHSDSYAVGVFLMDYWADLPLIRWLASTLFHAATEKTDSLLKKAKSISRLPLGPYARFRLFLRRHPRILRMWSQLKIKSSALSEKNGQN